MSLIVKSDMIKVKQSDLDKIPSLDISNIQGRVISTLTFYIEGEWQMWIPTSNGMQKIKGQPVEMFYFADNEKPESENDIYFDFFDFLAQHATFPAIIKPLSGLEDDFFNITASLAKLDLLYRERKALNGGVSRMVSTEIEYIFMICKSIFDLLQEIISKLWDTVSLHDKKIEKRPLPETFSKIIKPLVKNEEVEILASKYGLPLPLAEFYSRNLEFFIMLREFRDNLSHRGSSVETIFSTDKGFAVCETLMPFAKFGIWTEEHKQKNKLCSLRPAIGYVINQTLVACEDFSKTIANVINFPSPIAPNLRLFMRGYFNDYLKKNVDAIKKCQWWDAT